MMENNIRCENGAPYIAYLPQTGRWKIAQGCCNSWTCVRCGEIRAKQEYGKMVGGIQQLADEGHTLFFLTITCKGKEQSVEQAEQEYLAGTNRLFTAMRAQSRRADRAWHYVQVTERQKRGHPHSHIVLTWRPPEDYAVYRLAKKSEWLEIEVRSEWLKKRLVASELGRIHNMTIVQSAAGAARYCAKYLFKSAMLEEWPKGWKRVRYSQNWPKTECTDATETRRLMTRKDWNRFDRECVAADVIGDADLLYVAKKLPNVILRQREN